MSSPVSQGFTSLQLETRRELTSFQLNNIAIRFDIAAVFHLLALGQSKLDRGGLFLHLQDGKWMVPVVEKRAKRRGGKQRQR